MGNLVTFVTLKNGKVFKKRRYTVEQPAIYHQKSKGKLTRKRSMQYVPDMESVFIDEQKKIDPNVKRTEFAIDKGTLTIDRDIEPNKVDFLERHHNLGKPNHFKILNIEEERMYEIQQMEETDNAKTFVFKAEENIIRAIAIELISPHLGQTRSLNKLRLDLRQLAEKNMSIVARINSFTKDNYNQEKLLVSTLLTARIIKLNGKTFSWTNSDEKIFTASQANDAPKDFAIWLKNDEEGRQIQGIFADQLTKLKKNQNV